VRSVLHYSFVEFFDDMALWLLLGIALGGIVTAAVPLDTLNAVGGGTLVSMFIMLIVGIPLYICASATTPVAAGLIASGLNPGAALVLLLVGPATNSGSLVLLGRFLGRRTVLTYLLVVGGVSLAMGAVLNMIIGARGLDPRLLAHNHEMMPPVVHVAATIVLSLFFALSIGRSARRYFAKAGKSKVGTGSVAEAGGEVPAKARDGHAAVSAD